MSLPKMMEEFNKTNITHETILNERELEIKNFYINLKSESTIEGDLYSPFIEEGLEYLEMIGNKIEDGDITLEEALKMYNNLNVILNEDIDEENIEDIIYTKIENIKLNQLNQITLDIFTSLEENDLVPISIGSHTEKINKTSFFSKLKSSFLNIVNFKNYNKGVDDRKLKEQFVKQNKNQINAIARFLGKYDLDVKISDIKIADNATKTFEAIDKRGNTIKGNFVSGIPNPTKIKEKSSWWKRSKSWKSFHDELAKIQSINDELDNIRTEGERRKYSNRDIKRSQKLYKKWRSKYPNLSYEKFALKEARKMQFKVYLINVAVFVASHLLTVALISFLLSLHHLNLSMKLKKVKKLRNNYKPNRTTDILPKKEVDKLISIALTTVKTSNKVINEVLTGKTIGVDNVMKSYGQTNLNTLNIKKSKISGNPISTHKEDGKVSTLVQLGYQERDFDKYKSSYIELHNTLAEFIKVYGSSKPTGRIHRKSLRAVLKITKIAYSQAIFNTFAVLIALGK